MGIDGAMPSCSKGWFMVSARTLSLLRLLRGLSRKIGEIRDKSSVASIGFVQLIVDESGIFSRRQRVRI